MFDGNGPSCMYCGSLLGSKFVSMQTSVIYLQQAVSLSFRLKKKWDDWIGGLKPFTFTTIYDPLV